MTGKRKSITTALLTLFSISLFAVTAISRGETGPDEVTLDQLESLYDVVVFDHLSHQDMYDCGRCHHGVAEEQEGCMTCHTGRPKGTEASCMTCHAPTYEAAMERSKESETQKNSYHIDTPGLVGAYHMLCRNCHLEEGGPTDCQECHGFTEKGQKFFHEKQ